MDAYHIHNVLLNEDAHNVIRHTYGCNCMNRFLQGNNYFGPLYCRMAFVTVNQKMRLTSFWKFSPPTMFYWSQSALVTCFLLKIECLALCGYNCVTSAYIHCCETFSDISQIIFPKLLEPFPLVPSLLIFLLLNTVECFRE